MVPCGCAGGGWRQVLLPDAGEETQKTKRERVMGNMERCKRRRKRRRKK
jgi:hypothetical protein